MTSPHIITISPVRGAGGQRYAVEFRGEVLILRARDPEHEAARALLAMGFTGSLETRWAGSSTPAMRLDIERAAERSVIEGSERPRFRRFNPFDPEAREQAATLPP